MEFLKTLTTSKGDKKNSSTSLNKSPGFVAAKNHLTELIRQQNWNELDLKYAYDPALSTARKVWIKHFVFPVLLPTMACITITARMSDNFKWKLASFCFWSAMGTKAYQKEFGRFDLETERTVRVLETNTPIAHYCRTIIYNYEPNHWLLEKYEKIRENEELKLKEKKAKQRAKRKQKHKNKNNNNDSDDSEDSDDSDDSDDDNEDGAMAFARNWYHDKWYSNETEYKILPGIGDTAVQEQLRLQMKTKNMENQNNNSNNSNNSNNDTTTNNNNNIENSLNVSDIDSEIYGKSSFIPEFPLPKEELTFATDNRNAIILNNKIDNINESENENENENENGNGNVSKKRDRFYADSRLFGKKSTLPDVLKNFSQKEKKSDEIWLESMGIEDKETQEYLLKNVNNFEEMIEDCWKIGEEYKRCKAKQKIGKSTKHECKQLQKRYDKCQLQKIGREYKGLS